MKPWDWAGVVLMVCVLALHYVALHDDGTVDDALALLAGLERATEAGQ